MIRVKRVNILKLGMCVGLVSLSLVVGGPMQASATETSIVEVKDVSMKQVKSNVWMHTSIGVVGMDRVPANGLVVETSKGLLLIDTPWNDTLTEQLLELVKKQFPTNKEITDAIVTHAHDDRVGGIKTLLKNGIKVHSTLLTADLAQQQGFERPLGDLGKHTKLRIGNVQVETFYPGKGHTKDNIVVWLPEHKMLFGGCLIKSLDSKTIIPTPGSYVSHWPHAIKKVQKKYNNIDVVVPGHGEPGDDSLLAYTIDLLNRN
jgi:metallo-beta-lactamase class B